MTYRGSGDRHGYNNIPLTLPGASPVVPGHREQEIDGAGLLRVADSMNLVSMLCPADLERLQCPTDAPERQLLGLSNPQSAEAVALRTTLLPALLSACAYNQSRRVRDIALYELNRVFFPRAEGELPEEPLRVAGALTGSPWTAGWNLPEECAEVDFFWLKGLIEQFLRELGLGPTSDPEIIPPLRREGCAEVTRGRQRRLDG